MTIRPTPKSPDAVPWNRSYGTIGLVGSLALAHTVLRLLGAFLKVVYILTLHFYGHIQELDVSSRLYTVLLCVTRYEYRSCIVGIRNLYYEIRRKCWM